MLNVNAQWRPGSFTKNFSWGQPRDGLKRLHEAIQVGFDGVIAPTPRADFRKRVASLGRPDFIPLNFFLLNAIVASESVVLVDELVYQALSRSHDSAFDSLALIAFNNSYVGKWAGSSSWQSFPSAWAFHYITQRVAKELRWDTASINADDIERFITSSDKYTGDTSRKLSTNLAYMYRVGGLSKLSVSSVDHSWANTVFLCLDRVSAESGIYDGSSSIDDLLSRLELNNFDLLSGINSLDRELALEPLCRLYSACGGLERWTIERVHERQKTLIPHINQYLGSNEPWVVVDPLDPSLLKSIPQTCAMLARYVAKFEDAGDPASFNIMDFVKSRTQNALHHLKAINVSPRMSAEDLLRLTRE